MGDVPTWLEIGRASRALALRFPGDHFIKTVLKGCIDVGKRRSNPIRGNLVAAGLREVVGHVIHKLSPDAEVRACVWFVQADDTKTVTRRQRVHYIVKGGLPDAFVKDVLKFDVKVHADELIEIVDELNKVTHIRPCTVFANSMAIRQMFIDVISGLEGLLLAAEDSRVAVQNEVGAVMQNAVFEKLISEAFQELDELSTHTAVDHHWLDEVEVRKIDAETIVYQVGGTVVVDLQYGSGSDVANDIGFRTTESYPYEAVIMGAAHDPLRVDVTNIDLKIDNSSFYE